MRSHLVNQTLNIIFCVGMVFEFDCKQNTKVVTWETLTSHLYAMYAVDILQVHVTQRPVVEAITLFFFFIRSPSLVQCICQKHVWTCFQRANLNYIYRNCDITLFKSITMFCETDNNVWNIPSLRLGYGSCSGGISIMLWTMPPSTWHSQVLQKQCMPNMALKTQFQGPRSLITCMNV